MNMSSNTRPWNHSPHYIAATQVLLRPGPVSNYVVPRRIGHSEFDVTGFVFGQAEWSKENLPDILYVLEAPSGWDKFRKSSPPAQKKDANGNRMFERYDRPLEYDKDGKQKPQKSREPLLDFPVLPDVIGTQEPWWYFEAVRRIDPRIRWIDITMRMALEGRPSENSLNQDGVRNRPKYGMRSWFPKQVHQNHNARRDAVMGMLSDEQIAANTTRGTTPGLKDPALGEAGGRIPHPEGRKGLGVRRGPRKKGPSKASQEVSDNEADDKVAESEYGDDEASDKEDSDSWTDPIESRVKRTRRTMRQSTFEAAKNWSWKGNTLVDGKGLGKSRPSLPEQSTELQAPADGRVKRKLEEDGGERLDLPRKKRVVAHPSGTPSQSRPFQLPRNLATQSFASNQAYHKTATRPRIRRRLDWHAIDHGTPYDLTSYGNFFRGLRWDTQPTLGVSHYGTSEGPQPASQSSHAMAGGTSSMGAAAADTTSVAQMRPCKKRNRDDNPLLEEDTGHTTKKSRRDSASGTITWPVYVESGSSESDVPSKKTPQQPLMVVLSPTRSSKRRRNPKNSWPNPEEEIVQKARISGDSFKADLDYHYPPILPARIHRDGSRTWG